MRCLFVVFDLSPTHNDAVWEQQFKCGTRCLPADGKMLIYLRKVTQNSQTPTLKQSLIKYYHITSDPVSASFTFTPPHFFSDPPSIFSTSSSTYSSMAPHHPHCLGDFGMLLKWQYSKVKHACVRHNKCYQVILLYTYMKHSDKINTHTHKEKHQGINSNNESFSVGFLPWPCSFISI